MEKVEDHIIELVDISPSSPENSEAGCPQCSRLLLFISEISKLALAELGRKRADLGGTATPRGVAEGRESAILGFMFREIRRFRLVLARFDMPTPTWTFLLKTSCGP